jgi:hypothetical protein
MTMASAKFAAITRATATAISAQTAKKEFAATRQSARIADTKLTTMSDLNSSALRIAFSAVKMQRITADKREAWLDAKMREAYVAAESALEIALREADLAKEIASRGGVKDREFRAAQEDSKELKKV